MGGSRRPKLLITAAARATSCIRFRGRIDQPRHMVKLVNFDTFAP
jgi:hypothetical protein